MTPTLLLDTHIWLWWILGQSELPKKERAALDAMAASGSPPKYSPFARSKDLETIG